MQSLAAFNTICVRSQSTRMLMQESGRLAFADEIATRGFVVLRDVIDLHELQALRRTLAESTGGRSDAVRWTPSPSVPRSLAVKLKDIEQLCLPASRLLAVGAFFFKVARDPAVPSVDFPWHIDHESYYLYGQHRHYLNLWIPIEKESAEDANLCLVPFDQLASVDQELCGMVVGAGAVKVQDGQFFFDSLGLSRECKCDLDSIAETPKLRPGDLLILRGDVLHRTQNRRIDRIALSIRLIDRAHVILASHYYPLIPSHLRGLLNAVRPYAANAYLFEKTQRARMSVEQLVEAARELKRAPVDSLRDEFAEFLTRYTAQLEARLESSTVHSEYLGRR